MDITGSSTSSNSARRGAGSEVGAAEVASDSNPAGSTAAVQRSVWSDGEPSSDVISDVAGRGGAIQQMEAVVDGYVATKVEE